MLRINESAKSSSKVFYLRVNELEYLWASDRFNAQVRDRQYEICGRREAIARGAIDPSPKEVKFYQLVHNILNDGMNDPLTVRRDARLMNKYIVEVGNQRLAILRGWYFRGKVPCVPG